MKTIVITTLLIVMAMCSIQAQQTQLFDDRPKITVNGEAVIKVQPDQIIITFGIETWDKNIMAAKQENNEILKRAVAVIKESGIPDKDIQTDHLSIEPRYGDNYEKRNFIGYFVRNTFVVTVAEPDKTSIGDTAKVFSELGFNILATEGTYKYLTDKGIKAQQVLKVHEGRPNIVDAIKNNEIQLIVNTPVGRRGQHDDSYIRKAAIKYKIPYITTATAAAATAKGITARQGKEDIVKSVQDYHADIV